MADERYGAIPLPNGRSIYCPIAKEYLDAQTWRYTNGERPYTPATYLAYALRGKARRWSARYAQSLERALRILYDAGVITPVPSVRWGCGFVWSEVVKEEPTLECPYVQA